jgi:Tc5 transposase DNA-binding domain/helix-turn-helix, Psq domain
MARNTATARKRANQKKLKSEEPRLQKAVDALKEGKITHISAAARHFKVPYGTLRRRYQEETKPHADAHKNQQLLSMAQEETLCEWIKFMGIVGHPLTKAALRIKVAAISLTLREEAKATGKACLPGKNWTYGFLLRHPDLKLKRPTGLDPRRAQNFNPTVVKTHFQKLRKLIEENDIPWENIYNMDEKGIQLGGGRKLDNTKYLFGNEQRIYVKIQSADLELVTMIETIAADGLFLKPTFVFCGKSVLHEGYFGEDGIL